MAYELTIEPLGVTIDVEEGQNILDAALRNGIYLPHACCHGLCATCKIQVVDGDIEHGDASPFALMDFERDEGKALACCATLCSDATLEAEIDEEPDAETIPVRDLLGSVVALEQLTPTVKGVFIRLDEPLRFQAGQYVNLHIPGAGCTRAFSIASHGGDPTLIELNVRIVPGGVGTTYVHEKLAVGERVTISGPYGRFFVRKSARAPMLFMAGGSGLSSPRAMIHELLREDCTLPITLVYGQRSRQELYYHDEFLELARRHPNFTYVPALSDASGDAGWDGYLGFVHEAAREHFDNDFRGHKAYLCGPPPMIEACLAALMQGQLYERDIYTEKFISAADAQQVRSPLFKRV
ncbi:phenol hydroxylase [Massilia sp. WF1]|uniref:NADH:ubiquinone reductase (Na(+)-transporting) subunit F n=1 Tax=unclassified Massilia TaxID=2609279 RepID=UPI0006922015|nr:MULTISPECIES: phenol 2-monooxygenase domain-containing protein [unclassified Massilia]ALK97919.1 phenol hydroxylase [Massilia sp. WG5]KNZ67659.1 phenol hydroxylase [Massilia sp. WF1]